MVIVLNWLNQNQSTLYEILKELISSILKYKNYVSAAFVTLKVTFKQKKKRKKKQLYILIHSFLFLYSPLLHGNP